MSIELDDNEIKKILQGITIPPQPQIMVDLQMEQFAPQPNMTNIANLIAQDVGLAGAMLKTVNSAAYGLTNTITSVQQAVMLLGIRSVVNIVNGLSIRGELSDDDIVELNSFWDTSMDIAVVSQNVAKQIGMPIPEDAYALGLFHNAGIVLMHQQFPNYAETLVESYSGQHERVVDLETSRYKTNHAIIGYYTASSWRLPKPICAAIAEHHNIANVFASDSDADNAKKALLAVLKIAEYLCGNSMVVGQTAEDIEWLNIKTHIYEFTGLGDYDLENMVDQYKEMGVASVIANH